MMGSLGKSVGTENQSVRSPGHGTHNHRNRRPEPTDKPYKLADGSGPCRAHDAGEDARVAGLLFLAAQAGEAAERYLP
jgi:hypothetical protein